MRIRFSVHTHATGSHPEHLAALGGAVFKKEADLKPHRVRYWLTPKPDPAFDAKCADICAVYKAAATPDDDHRTISIDEMTGIQALERIAPGLPMAPGKVERREFEYRRHGTQTLIAAFDVATGKVEGVTGNTRTETDFARFLRHLLTSAAPSIRWDIVCDNLNIYLSEAVVRLVARHCGLKDMLGVKGKSGVFASKLTRAAFLCQPEHRITFHFTPRHASWLNQIEIWFCGVTEAGDLVAQNCREFGKELGVVVGGEVAKVPEHNIRNDRWRARRRPERSRGRFCRNDAGR